MILKKIFLTFFIFIFSSSLIADEINIIEKNTEFNIYSGIFDFSDDGKRSALIGFQHQNENLNRDTFLGNLSPITGFMITADSAGYIYTGVKLNIKLEL